MQNNKFDKIYFERIVRTNDTIEYYINIYAQNYNEENFFQNAILKDACLMQLINLGEYVSKISDESKENSSIDWNTIKAARNYYAHAYDYINWVRIWEVLKLHLPILKKSS